MFVGGLTCNADDRDTLPLGLFTDAVQRRGEGQQRNDDGHAPLQIERSAGPRSSRRQASPELCGLTPEIIPG